MSTMPRLDVQAIYNALDYDWWQDNQINDSGPLFQSTTIYFQDLIGNWHAFTSTGPCPQNPDYTVDPTTREYYVKDYLMWEAARWLANAQAAGSITNIKPVAYQVFPIFGH